MVTEITVNNSEEFQELIDNQDFRISKAIVGGILKNLSTTKNHIHVLTVNCVEEKDIFDITIERKYFADTLEENLVHYVREELYEECQVIASTIDKLRGVIKK